MRRFRGLGKVNAVLRRLGVRVGFVGNVCIEYLNLDHLSRRLNDIQGSYKIMTVFYVTPNSHLPSALA